MARTDNLTNFLTDVANAIRAKAGTSETIQASAFDTAIANIPSGGVTPTDVEEKDINYYNHDGLRVYSYTVEEFMELEEEPTPPSYSGLIPSENMAWNCSLSDIQFEINDLDSMIGYTESYKKDIGAIYYTSDDKNRIYINIEKGLEQVTLTLELTETVVQIAGQPPKPHIYYLDWGDGSATTTVNDTDEFKKITITHSHTYSTTGNYVIKIWSEYLDNMTFKVQGNSYGSNLLSDGTLNSTSKIRYLNMIQKIETTTNFGFLDYGLNNLGCCKSIAGFWYDGTEPVEHCYSLKALIIAGTLDSRFSINDCSISVISLPYWGTQELNITNCPLLKQCNAGAWQEVESFALNNLKSLKYFVYPATYNMETVPSKQFENCSSCKYIDFSLFTLYFGGVPELENIDAFDGLPNDYKILVPESMYDGWIEETNWEDIADHIEAIPDI